MATFETGATRMTDRNKFDYEGFFSPLVLERRAEYMHKHRSTPDGGFRDSDNWQLGIPLRAYMKSAWRHFFDWWKLYRGGKAYDAVTGEELTIEDALCALMFNAEGFLHEWLKKKREGHDNT